VAIIGPDEAKNNTVTQKLKNQKSGDRRSGNREILQDSDKPE
jgi:hypothetical protein